MNEENYQVLQPVKVVSQGLVTYTGDNILTGCFSTASVTDKDADGILLGFETSEGPLAIQDFSLGQVCCRHTSCSLCYWTLPSTGWT